MKYDWTKYTARSDVRYKAARDNNNVEDLQSHNILKGGEVELRFVRDLAKSRNPTIDFFISNASELVGEVSQYQYDFILAREVHCFSRISDDVYHQNLVETYLGLLKPGGVLVIAHSRTGVDTQYPSIDFQSLSNVLDSHKYVFTGPHFTFLYKHLKLFIPFRSVISVQSYMTRLIALLSGKRWIEFFILLKKQIFLGSNMWLILSIN